MTKVKYTRVAPNEDVALPSYGNVTYEHKASFLDRCNCSISPEMRTMLVSYAAGVMVRQGDRVMRMA